MNLRKWMKNLLSKRELKKMDDFSDYMGFHCYELFPPSFYCTHTKKEIEKATKELMDDLRRKVDEM